MYPSHCTLLYCDPKFIADAVFHSDPILVNDDGSTIQQYFDDFYNLCTQLLDQFFPTSTVTITSKDPPYITPQIKYMLKTTVYYVLICLLYIVNPNASLM